MNEKARVIDGRKIILRARVRGQWSTLDNRGCTRKGGGKRRDN